LRYIPRVLHSLLIGVYSTVARLAQPWLRAKLRRRGQAEPGYLHAVDERFGRYTTPRPDADAASGRPLVWIHAVSLGETRAAATLLAALRAQCPGLRLLLTHGTATGRAEGLRLLQPGDAQVWQPWDTPAAVRRFLRHFRPDVGVLMETEVWPNLVREAAAHGVPLALANARLSARSLRGAQRAGALLRPAYAALAAAWAQTEADAARLRVRQPEVRRPARPGGPGPGPGLARGGGAAGGDAGQLARRRGGRVFQANQGSSARQSSAGSYKKRSSVAAGATPPAAL
jgi:3-deoxy-D-manno-octulosonic-acid transferase